MTSLSDNAAAVLPIDSIAHGWCDVVGRGRMGSALATALRASGLRVRGPLGRGADGVEAAIVLLCVPDREIATAAAALAPGPLVGHVSASADLALLAPHRRFALHPLISVVGSGANFSGVTCAIDGATADALACARALAERLGMHARMIPSSQRPLYHAAASVASNYLTTVEGMAEQMARMVGLDREALVPLVRSAVEHWAALGAQAALTGPIARGDLATVEQQRNAVALATPELLATWDALAEATRTLASTSRQS